MKPKGLTLTGFVVAAALEQDPSEPVAALRRVEELLIGGALEQEIETLPLEQVAEAHRLFESRPVVGKIVLLP